MAEIKKIESLTFTQNRDPALINKLNVVAPYTRRKVHDLVRFILNEALDKLLTEYGIVMPHLEDSQPARKTG